MTTNQSVYITRINAVLPNAPIDNDAMEDVLGQVGDTRSRARALILRNNGIKNRHYVIDPETGTPTMNNAQLTAAAVRGLTGDGFELDDIDLLATGTSSPDQIMPNHAVMVHGELRSRPCETMSAAGICVSGVNALKYAWQSMSLGEHRNAVVTGSEVASTFMWSRNFVTESDARVAALEENPAIAFDKDFLRWMLSDGAAATLLQSEPRNNGLSLRVEWIDHYSYANRYPVCMYAGGERDEDGNFKGWREYGSAQEVAERSVFAVKQDTRLLDWAIIETFSDSVRAMREKRGLKLEDVNWFLPHYSSEYFRKRCYDALPADFKIPLERWFTNLPRVGNVGSASIYLILNELFHSGKLKDGEKLLCYIPESGRFSSAFVYLTAVVK